MKAHTLQDEKGYRAQVNCDKVFDNGAGEVHVIAGEDGLISVRHMRKSNSPDNMDNNFEDFKMLEKMTNAEGFLTNIEDVCQIQNGDLVVVCVDGDIGVYVYNPNSNYSNQKGNAYTLKKLIPPTTDDCLYYIIANENVSDTDTKKNVRSVTVWGEKNIKYTVTLS